MRNILAVAKRIILQVGMDKRTLGLMLFAPILMTTLLWVVINSGAKTPTIAVYNINEEEISSLGAYAHIKEAASIDAALALVKEKSADAAYYFLDDSDTPQIVVDGADPSISALVLRSYQKNQMDKIKDSPLAKRNPQLLAQMQPSVSFLHGSENKSAFDYLAPVMMGFVIFFFIFIISAISFLRERTSGTLERVLVAPTKRMDIVLGYMIGFGLFALLQTFIIQAFVIWVLGIPILGSFLEIFAINLALCLVALSMGSFISAFAQNEFQILQFIPIVIVPQIIFSGILDLRDSPAWVQWLSQIFPLTYAGDALREIMVRGSTLLDVLPQFLIVLGFAALFIVLNTLAIKKTKS